MKPRRRKARWTADVQGKIHVFTWCPVRRELSIRVKHKRASIVVSAEQLVRLADVQVRFA